MALAPVRPATLLAERLTIATNGGADATVKILELVAVLVLVTACSSSTSATNPPPQPVPQPATVPVTAPGLVSAPFGTTADGQPVPLYTMSTAGGVRVSFMNYGGVITDVSTPDRQGRLAPVVLGFRTFRDYETTSADGQLFFGALIGRYANWIAGGRFSLDGREYQIPVTNSPHTIHGGPRGFDKRIWTVRPLTTSGPDVSAQLTYTSADGEEGFPGALQVAATYTLSQAGAFGIHYRATSDRDTVVNLISHMNFNLAGAGPGTILDHILTVDADQYLPHDRGQIPLGDPALVEAPRSTSAHRRQSAPGSATRTTSWRSSVATTSTWC